MIYSSILSPAVKCCLFTEGVTRQSKAGSPLGVFAFSLCLSHQRPPGVFPCLQRHFQRQMCARDGDGSSWRHQDAPAVPKLLGNVGLGKPWAGGIKLWESPEPCSAHQQHLPLGSSLPLNRKEMQPAFPSLPQLSQGGAVNPSPPRHPPWGPAAVSMLVPPHLFPFQSPITSQGVLWLLQALMRKSRW